MGTGPAGYLSFRADLFRAPAYRVKVPSLELGETFFQLPDQSLIGLALNW